MRFSYKKQNVAWLSVASNTFLTSAKLVTGFLTGSVSILSEAAHSAIDLIAAIIATFSVHMSDRPPDKTHPYGHEKIENISGVIEGVLIFIAAVWIIYEAVDKLIHGVELKHLGPGALVMAISAGLNIIVATLLKRSAVENRSVALEADAAHLYTDVYTSLGVFAGLFIITAGERLWALPLSWLDPVIAIGVAFLILSTAYKITRKSFLPLMDASASAGDVLQIRSIMDSFGARGLDFHDLRTRPAGGSLHVDLHMGCKPGVSLEEGHAISHELKAEIEGTVAGSKVLVHVEPSKCVDVLPETDPQVAYIREQLIKDSRVGEIINLRITRYRGDERVEADLLLDPDVTLAESRVLTTELTNRLESHYPTIKETILSLRPGNGWLDAIHEDDRVRIQHLVGEHQSAFTGIHKLDVIFSGGVHRIRLALGVPPQLPVSEANAIGRHIESDIQALFPGGADIDIHIEPCNEDCKACHVMCDLKTRNIR